MPRLCSVGCSSSDATLHSFPNKDKDPERFKMWVSLVGGKLETASDYEYYGKKKVCARHFTDQDRNRNNRLNALAVPSLHLLGIPPRQTEMANTPDVSETNKRVNQPSILHPINTAMVEMQEESGQRNYVCGWVLTKCLENVCKSCEQCRQTLLDIDETNIKNGFITAKDYNKKKWLCYPSVALDNCFQDLQKLTKSFF